MAQQGRGAVFPDVGAPSATARLLRMGLAQPQALEEAAAQQLGALFPDIGASVVSAALRDNRGDAGAAAEALRGLAAPTNVVEDARVLAGQPDDIKVTTIQTVLNEYGKQQILAALQRCGGSVEGAITELFNEAPRPDLQQPQIPQPLSSQPRPQPQPQPQPQLQLQSQPQLQRADSFSVALGAIDDSDIERRVRQENSVHALPPSPNSSADAVALASPLPSPPSSSPPPQSVAATALPTDVTAGEVANTTRTTAEDLRQLQERLQRRGREHEEQIERLRQLQRDRDAELQRLERTAATIAADPHRVDLTASMLPKPPAPIETDPELMALVSKIAQATTATASACTQLRSELKASPSREDAGAVLYSFELVDHVPSPRDWVALFIHDREYTYEQSACTGGKLKGSGVFRGLRDGFYDVRLFLCGSKVAALISAPVLVGTLVHLSATYLPEERRITAKYSPPGDPKDWVGLFSTATRSNQTKYSLERHTCSEGSSSTLDFTAPRMPGSYHLRYFKITSGLVYSAISLPIEVTVQHQLTATVTADETALTVTWLCTSQEPSSYDWVGLYSSVVAQSTSYVAYQYCFGRGETPKDRGSLVFELTKCTIPGEYEVRFFSHNNGKYTPLMRQTFALSGVGSGDNN
eukprot:TRINITY_DN2522_c0_g2_i1.p1 TRINITY_DN2522_c0_g2~~TRINITY_DN2522_c0_g2_i1.p1  ORF type:complete len:677 (-),score=154.74 TRINITY_DN2522_c0_g2_i1:95-2014(-)